MYEEGNKFLRLVVLIQFCNKEDILAKELLKHIVIKRVNGSVAFFANIADIHQGLNDRKLLQSIVAWILSIPNFYVGIGGDSMNIVTRNSKGSMNEEWAVGDKQLLALIEDLMPLAKAGRILYIINGNHTKGRVEDTVFITLEMLLATMLGIPQVYKEDVAILYFNVNKNLYIHFTQHKSGKVENKFSWVNSDCIWREHIHEYKAIPRFELRHNIVEKKPIVRQTWEVFSGSMQIYPSYAKANGYRPLIPGCMIAEMSGKTNDWKIRLTRDEDLYHYFENGYVIN